jgi:hypothetical protein
MRKVVSALTALVFCLCFVVLAKAADMKMVGFDYGVNFIKPSDSRFDAYSTAFTLYVPVSSKMMVGYMHENVNMSGEDNGTSARGPVTVDALRMVLNLADINGVTVSGLMDVGVGNANIGALTDTAPIGDIGVGVTYIPLKGDTIKASLGVTLMYRFFKVDSTNLFGAGTDNVDDLGGFGVGLHMTIAY